MKLLGAYNDTGIDSLPLIANYTIEQSFIAPLDNLNQIDLIFTKAPILKSTLIELLVIDAKTSSIVATSQAQLNPNQVHSFVSFFFPTINNSSNQAYFLKASLLGNFKEPISLKITPENYYQSGNLTVNNQSVPGDLVFRTYHQTTKSPLVIVNSSIFTKFKNDSTFSLIYFLLLAVIIKLLIKSIYKSK